MNTSETSEIISQLNAEEVHRLMPAIVYLVILIITGSLGNTLVMYVYCRCFRPSNIKYFILCLSGIDLFSCCVVIPLEITVMTMPYTLQFKWLCKTSRFLNTLVTMTSAGILMLIAIDRYRKMCKPFGWQIGLKYVKHLCWLSLLLGLLLSWPALLIYGCKTLTIPGQYNLEGVECSTDDSMKDTHYPLMSSIIMLGIFIIGMTSVSILYCLIGFAIHAHVKRMPKDFRAITKRKLKQMDSVSTTEITSERSKSQSIDSNTAMPLPIKRCLSKENNSKSAMNSNHAYSEVNKAVENEDCDVNNTSAHSLGDTETADISINHNTVNNNKFHANDAKLSVASSVESISYRKNRNQRNPKFSASRVFILEQQSTNVRKTSLMMLIISSTYIVSFVPHLLLMLLRELKSDFEDMSESDRVVYAVFLRSYFLNFAANPVIYCLYGSNFRFECKTLFKSMFCKTDSE